MKKASNVVISVVMILGLVMMFSGCAGSKENMDETPASAAADAPPADMAGLWIMQVETPRGTGTPSFDINQEGNELSGTYSGKFGEFPITGTVTGNQFEISYDSSGTLVKYIGETDGAKCKGKVDYGSYGGGTFTGEKN